MLSEVLYGLELARRVGMAGQFRGVVAVAEQLPFVDGAMDAMYAVGCLHHMAAEFTTPEIHRVLRSGGTLAAVEPWKAVLHTVGTAVLGKPAETPTAVR